MTGSTTNINKMFRWLKDKKKTKHEKKGGNVEDDYGFRKKQIILQESENGHSVIIKDNETTVVYPQSFCKFNYRARMPTPVQNVSETSTHIYDEIHELSARAKLELELTQNEADIIKDTRAKCARQPVDLRNAIEVGPYLIVPLVNSKSSLNGDVEIFKRNETQESIDKDFTCLCESKELCTCHKDIKYSPPWDANRVSNVETVNDTKVVLTRCVKSKSCLNLSDNLKPQCSTSQIEEMCSFENGALESRVQNDSPGADSNSRTLTGTPDSCSNTTDTLDLCVASEVVNDATKHCCGKNAETDGNDTCNEYDLSTSGESDLSGQSDYELYLSKIENNLKLKHNVRNMIRTVEDTIPESDEDNSSNSDDVDTMTYVSCLSECSSATSHISDVSADRSASDDSSGYYECSDEIQTPHDIKRDSRVSLERSVSAPESSETTVKFTFSHNKKPKDKLQIKSKKHKSERSKSFDSRIYKALSDEDKEMYLFPSNKKSGSISSLTSGSKKSRNKPVLTPQPTPVYMDPYRAGKTGSHNRLLGDLIRMNYDKQLFIH